MANELYWRHSTTGGDLYVSLRSLSLQYYNTDTPGFEALTVANWADYDIALAETPANSYLYVGDMPAVAAGFYWVDVFEREGASPAIGDELIGTLLGYWDATAFRPYVPSVVDANVTYVNSIEIGGTGTEIDPWGPAE
jgi:hypothetical protein